MSMMECAHCGRPTEGRGMHPCAECGAMVCQACQQVGGCSAEGPAPADAHDFS